MTIDDMISMKKEQGYSFEYISSISGVPASTVQKILSKTTTTPRRITLLALERAFQQEKLAMAQAERQAMSPMEKMAQSETEGIPGSGGDALFVRESSGWYTPTDGTGALHGASCRNKTIRDYQNLPEGVRVELIDGEFYDLAAPTPLHQMLCTSLWAAFSNYIDSKGGSCIPFVAPLDVQLDRDEKTLVQPDVLVVCDRDKMTNERIVGAPDLIAEILSPSTWYHDTIRKMIKYKRAGVREYWIVMPQQKKILVYFFEKSDLPVEYDFEASIPVAIWEGKAQVDFRKIYEKIRFLL